MAARQSGDGSPEQVESSIDELIRTILNDAGSGGLGGSATALLDAGPGPRTPMLQRLLLAEAVASALADAIAPALAEAIAPRIMQVLEGAGRGVEPRM